MDPKRHQRKFCGNQRKIVQSFFN